MERWVAGRLDISHILDSFKLEREGDTDLDSYVAYATCLATRWTIVVQPRRLQRDVFQGDSKSLICRL